MDEFWTSETGATVTRKEFFYESAADLTPLIQKVMKSEEVAPLKYSVVEIIQIYEQWNSIPPSQANDELHN